MTDYADVFPIIDPVTGTHRLEWKCPSCDHTNTHNGKTNKIPTEMLEFIKGQLMDQFGEHANLDSFCILPMEVWCQKCETNFNTRTYSDDGDSVDLNQEF